MSIDTDAPDPRKLVKLATQTLSSAERRRKYRKIDFLDTAYWYPTQLAFFADGGSGKHQRLIYGGNQTGKTLCAAWRPFPSAWTQLWTQDWKFERRCKYT